MKLTFEPKKYLAQQEIFTGEMVARIAEHLESYGVKEEDLKELTGKIAFEVACMIDDVAGIEFEGEVSSPFLTFISQENDEELLHFGTNSTTHEMVYGILNAMFKENT